jgi:hypothetical protein
VADKRTWHDLSSRQRGLIIAGGVAEVVLTTAALRDLRRRPGAAVRGPKLVWMASFVVQPFGPLAYLTIGRRTA